VEGKRLLHMHSTAFAVLSCLFIQVTFPASVNSNEYSFVTIQDPPRRAEGDCCPARRGSGGFANETRDDLLSKP
jgi:hypothetical protein